MVASTNAGPTFSGQNTTKIEEKLQQHSSGSDADDSDNVKGREDDSDELESLDNDYELSASPADAAHSGGDVMAGSTESLPSLDKESSAGEATGEASSALLSLDNLESSGDNSGGSLASLNNEDSASDGSLPSIDNSYEPQESGWQSNNSDNSSLPSLDHDINDGAPINERTTWPPVVLSPPASPSGHALPSAYRGNITAPLAQRGVRFSLHTGGTSTSKFSGHPSAASILSLTDSESGVVATEVAGGTAKPQRGSSVLSLTDSVVSVQVTEAPTPPAQPGVVSTTIPRGKSILKSSKHQSAGSVLSLTDSEDGVVAVDVAGGIIPLALPGGTPLDNPDKSIPHSSQRPRGGSTVLSTDSGLTVGTAPTTIASLLPPAPQIPNELLEFLEEVQVGLNTNQLTDETLKCMFPFSSCTFINYHPGIILNFTLRHRALAEYELTVPTLDLLYNPSIRQHVPIQPPGESTSSARNAKEVGPSTRPAEEAGPSMRAADEPRQSTPRPVDPARLEVCFLSFHMLLSNYGQR